MEQVAVCLSFDYLNNGSSDRLHTCRVYSIAEDQRKCIIEQQYRRPSNRPVLNRHVSNGHCTSTYKQD